MNFLRKLIKIGSLIIVFIPLTLFAQKSVLIEDAEDVGSAVEKSAVDIEKNVEGRLNGRRSGTMSERRSLNDVDKTDYDSTYSMRADRRVGLGVEMAGHLGLIGLNAELNFSLDDSAIIGYGGGPQYSSFELGWRHVFGGKSLAPYAGFAFSRWYNSSNSGGSISSTTPGFLAEKFLSSDEMQTGRFTHNFLIPSAGLQFNMLNGPYVGTCLYAEVMMLLDISQLQNVLTGSFGAIYYF